MARVSTTHPIVKTISGDRYLMTPTAFVSLDYDYVALRTDFKKVFLAGAAFPEKLIVQVRHRQFLRGWENRTEDFKVSYSNGRLVIGCHVFSAETKRQIMIWALDNDSR